MKIVKLGVEGFRSLRSESWEPGDLNVLIGPNASGKSNVLRVLEMLGVAARGGLGKFVQREGSSLCCGTGKRIDSSFRSRRLPRIPLAIRCVTL